MAAGCFVCRSHENFESDWTKVLAARKEAEEGREKGGGGPPVLAMSVEEVGVSDDLAVSCLLEGEETAGLPGGRGAASSDTGRFAALATSVERPPGSAPQDSPASTSGKVHPLHLNPIFHLHMDHTQEYDTGGCVHSAAVSE